LAAPQPLGKISRAIPPASAAIPARASNAHSVADAIVAAEAAQTAVEDVPIAVEIAAVVLPAHDSNAVPAAPAVPATIAGIVAIPARRAVRN
jgi:hypothetical protein